jgi:hypothetical protein
VLPQTIYTMRRLINPNQLGRTAVFLTVPFAIGGYYTFA